MMMKAVSITLNMFVYEVAVTNVNKNKINDILKKNKIKNHLFLVHIGSMLLVKKLYKNVPL